MSSTTTEHSSASIVSHIRDLLPLPRHAVFHVKLVIHQLSSVPLITGQFRIKWKFHNSLAVNSAGRPLGLGRILARKLEKRHGSDSGKGKGKEITQPEDPDEHERGYEQYESPDHALLTPEETPTPNGRPASTHSSARSSNSKLNVHTPPSDAAGVDYRPDASGHTPFLPLHSFKVNFDQQIDVAVQMSIDKDSLNLLPSELKLTVMQRVISGDPNAPLNPRLGHVQINLAEYVDAGSVTRNYLLRRSKVNAMLNMTITMTQLSGEQNYRAPPLRKEEIGAGIAEFLTLSQPLPALSRFVPSEDPWLASSLDLILPQQQQQQQQEEEPPSPDPPSVETEEYPTHRKKGRWLAKRHKSSGLSDPPPQPQQKPVEKEQLHPTEALIEAIFNPYPTTSTMPSPFTYYVPPTPPPVDGTGTDGTSRGSFDSSRQESTSELGHETGVIGHGSRSKWWRRKTSGTDSAPGTPARSNSTRS